MVLFLLSLLSLLAPPSLSSQSLIHGHQILLMLDDMGLSPNIYLHPYTHINLGASRMAHGRGKRSTK
jgi:hypothetical protein